jgi:hypothetical protein
MSNSQVLDLHPLHLIILIFFHVFRPVADAPGIIQWRSILVSNALWRVMYRLQLLIFRYTQTECK